MSYVKIWIHAVWATKSRRKLLTKEIRPTVFKHIHQNALKKEIFIDCVGGHIQHVHCLFRLKSNQTIENVMRLLKGESSFWINKQKLTKSKFGWKDKYYAVSVSESHVERGRKYILNQEAHHSKRTFQQEYEEFIEKYGFQEFKDMD